MSKTTYPAWTIDSLPYWEGCKQNELRYQTCDCCHEVVFHPRAACPYCLAPELTWRRSAGIGTIYSFAIQHVPLDRATPGKLPMTLAIVKLNEGFHMFTEISETDLGIVKIGASVEVWFDHVADDLALPKFKVSARSFAVEP